MESQSKIMKKYYKVVNDDLSSAYVGSLYGTKSLSVTYKIGEWVEPNIKGTDLMVFSDLESARNFLNDKGWGTKIFTCEVKNPRKRGLFIENATVSYILRAAKLRLKHKKFLNWTDKPKIEGTVFCKAIKLLEEVA